MEQPEKKKSHDFNIYYLNFSKVYEIAMMINNVILTKIETDKSSSFEEQYGYTSSISAQGTKQFLDGIKASISADARETSTSSSKVVESLDVKTTKSILLRRVIEQCASVTVLDSSAEGDLVKVDRVKLELLNEESLRQFLSLNKAKEQKVLSIFLFGASGIGKTEVARLIANGLQNDCYLAKINFQNYSSQDALNSLIGSPAGYVGCNHGELSEKIQKSKVGVLLCDEFEKTTRPVFSFFLELLEEGRFTDSMAREYDMDGYVIIFTSNLLSEAEYKKVIPPELQTRFDLVCEFEEPTTAEKTAFLDLLLEMAKTKYSEQFAKIEITEDDKKRLYAFDYSSLSALRDIKRVFNNRLMDYFVEKDVL